MVNPDFIRVLEKIYRRLKQKNINWVLTGSLGFAIQGVPTDVNDIDIQTDRDGAYGIERIFSEFITKKVHFLSSERIRSHFGEMIIDGIKVEIMGDIQKKFDNGTWEEKPDLEKYRRFVNIDEMNIPILSLDYEYQAYLKLGRVDKANMLKKWMERKDNL
jgi:hypothetical protein